MHPMHCTGVFAFRLNAAVMSSMPEGEKRNITEVERFRRRPQLLAVFLRIMWNRELRGIISPLLRLQEARVSLSHKGRWH